MQVVGWSTNIVDYWMLAGVHKELTGMGKLVIGSSTQRVPD